MSPCSFSTLPATGFQENVIAMKALRNDMLAAKVVCAAAVDATAYGRVHFCLVNHELLP